MASGAACAAIVAYPQTCDSEIREGDFVFLLQLSPAAWVEPDTDGVLRAGLTAASSPPGRVCLQQKEICYNSDVGLYCAWVMACPQ